MGARNTAVLACGTVLTFEVSNFVPAEEETVPCPRHGYCVVARAARSAGGGRSLRPRPRPRGERELVDWLSRQPTTTVHVLRRHRFTLRTITTAHRSGLVDADLVSGVVALRRVDGSGSCAPDGGPTR